MIEVDVINESSVVTPPDFAACVAALQMQVTRDFAPAWGIEASVTRVEEDETPAASAWQLVILDNSDQADALGYHELTAAGTPLGKVFAKSDQYAGLSWTVTASHELLEMVLDPWASLCSMGTDGKIRAFENCDAVEDDSLAYTINGVKVSDFVYPSWFDGMGGAPFDYCKKCSEPLQLLAGGYIGVLDPEEGWTQLTAETNSMARDLSNALSGVDLGNALLLRVDRRPINPQSRRARRIMGRANWRKSAA